MTAVVMVLEMVQRQSNLWFLAVVVVLDLRNVLLERDSASNRKIETLATQIRSHYWGCTIPWDIDDAEDEDAIEDAIEHWEENTPFNFRRRTTEDDYLMFVDSGGCSSFIGKQGNGRQDVFIGSSCSTGNIIHEIGHALGLFHEHQRIDRDNYVRVNWDNIPDDFKKNFEKNSQQSSNDVGKYDLASIMHYPTDAFADDDDRSLTVLVPVPDDIDIGQRDRLSLRDIDGSIFRYFPNCDEGTMTVSVKLGLGSSGTTDELRVEFPDHEFTYPLGFNFIAGTEYHEDIVVVEEIENDLEWIILIKEEIGTDAVVVDYIKIRYDGEEYTSGPRDLDVCLDSDATSCDEENVETRIDMFKADTEIRISLQMGNSGTKDAVFVKFNAEGPSYELSKELVQRQTKDFTFDIVEIDDIESVEIIKPEGTDALFISSVTIEYDDEIFESGDINICLDNDESTCDKASKDEVVDLHEQESPPPTPSPPPPAPPSPPSPSPDNAEYFEVKLAIGASATEDQIEISLGSQPTKYSMGDNFPKNSVISKMFELEESLDSLDRVTLYKEGQDSVFIVNIQVLLGGETYDSGGLNTCMDSDTSTCDEPHKFLIFPVTVESDREVEVVIDIGKSGTDDQMWLNINADIVRYNLGTSFPAGETREYTFMFPSTLRSIETVTINKEGNDAVFINRIQIEMDDHTYDSGEVERCLDGDDSTCVLENTYESFSMTIDDKK